MEAKLKAFLSAIMEGEVSPQMVADWVMETDGAEDALGERLERAKQILFDSMFVRVRTTSPWMLNIAIHNRDLCWSLLEEVYNREILSN